MVLTSVITLPLDGFREARIHVKKRRKALVKARSKLWMVLAQ